MKVYLDEQELVVWRWYSLSIQPHFEDPDYCSYNLKKQQQQQQQNFVKPRPNVIKHTSGS